LIEVCN